eukprot:TRINITY_DN64783_c3_g1_i1.p1 TRINITY_DN64783_c3_g1~~TRINITY_DN64783_c3_g1_i1.p1  ORF type:complete len:591 (+),score=-27.31 TRINITY_DN64783_c3_g1_i1:901-2673(+)
MPNIIFVLESVDGTPFRVNMPWTNYVDSVGNNKYAFRVYLSEGSGAVLGANFMNGMNVIFDRDKNRIGFATSSCIYEDFASENVKDDELDILNKTIDIDTENSSDGCESTFIPTAPCSARCDAYHNPPQYYAEGIQPGIDSCRKSKTGLEISLPNNKCHVLCDKSTVAVGQNPKCIISKWSDCSQNCTQWRTSYKNKKRLLRTKYNNHTYNYRHLEECGEKYIETRKCNTASCPMKGHKAGMDYLVIIDMKVNIPAILWGYAYENVFEEALAELFMIPVGSMDILTGSGSHDFAQFVKVRFEIRLNAGYYKNDITKLTKAAESIPTAVWLDDFSQKFIKILNEVSKRIDHIDYNRYGWLKGNDIIIINSMAIPLGGDKDASFASLPPLQTITIKKNGYSLLEIVLMVIVGVCGTLLACMLFFHIKLRKEHDELYMEKMTYKANFEKMGFGGTGGNTRKLIGKMWSNVKNAIQSTTDNNNNNNMDENNSFMNNKKSKKSKKSRKTSQNPVTNSLQSISTILTSATNPRHNDPVNSHRNYNSNYKYDIIHKQEDNDDIEMYNRNNHSNLVIADEDDEEDDDNIIDPNELNDN